jgi:general secretion pathway protein D
MVFLRPVVLRDAASGDRLSLDRYDLIRAQQQASQPAPNPSAAAGRRAGAAAAGPLCA